MIYNSLKEDIDKKTQFDHIPSLVDYSKMMNTVHHFLSLFVG